MPGFLNAFAILAAAVLFIGGACALFACLIVYGRALSALANARAHFSAAAAQEETVRAAGDAVDELRGHRQRLAQEPEYPSEADLRQAAYDQTLSELGVKGAEVPESYSTVEDHALRYPNPNGEVEIPPDKLYDVVQER